jgi:hypothetical protein
VARWTAGIAIAVAAIALFLMAVASAPASIRANNNLCLRQVANDEHASLEAFFRVPLNKTPLYRPLLSVRAEQTKSSHECIGEHPILRFSKGRCGSERP